MTRFRINTQRMLADLDTLRSIGAMKTGVVRPAYSEADRQARIWLAERMEEAGLEVSVDAIGNVFGLPPGNEKCILVGSHSDTQPEGGWLDGAYGVIVGLEIARASMEQGGPRVACVSFQDEEGRFSTLTGSRVWTGLISLEEADECRDGTGMRLGQARLERAGLPEAREVSTNRFSAFLEIHIEQGPVLDTTGERIGVVENIVGIRTEKMSFLGEQNHAGTTPMHLRRDAFQGLNRFVSIVNDRLAEVAAAATVWTVGHVDLHPNANSIVPGRADFTIQWRDADDARLERMTEIIYACARETAGSLGLEWQHFGCDLIAPTQSNATLVEAMAKAAENLASGLWRRMPSGALHDAANVSSVLPMAMLFVPSKGGISHNFSEDTDRADLALGAEVLAEVVAGLQ
ncbi:hydantoinase/carbamoylase family amidase [Mesorhizobium sp. 1B3]|uniref:hydantoinase/carbamoylase family amidase n=1 Tax=Mesorhizobium sp. 1B3 TaxID=3243599 RepID=UPI003D957E86